jgi:alkanesulfonate monooxygenase SsuD/methylene tetrahydromethanopterin reductase-like flavin-dependent oxidoreductase (luciferase family)
MKYGVTFPITGVDGDVNLLVDFASLAEEAGWDGVFLEDYISYYEGDEYTVFDPWLALAAMAVRTERLRLGITVSPLARRRPWKVARESVTLDHLSNGRFILGVGVGDSSDKSFSHFGEVTDVKQRAEMLDESLDILAGLWSGQPFSYSGKHYHVDEITFLPKPVQSPRIPIWVGGFWPRKGPARRAARWDGFCAAKINEDGTSGFVTPADVREMKNFIEQRRPAHTPFDFITGGQTPGDDPGQTRSVLEPFAEAGITWWMEFTTSKADELRKRIKQGPPRIE